jgi:hypothetical protein
MPLRTFVTKFKRFGLQAREWEARPRAVDRRRPRSASTSTVRPLGRGGMGLVMVGRRSRAGPAGGDQADRARRADRGHAGAVPHRGTRDRAAGTTPTWSRCIAPVRPATVDRSWCRSSSRGAAWTACRGRCRTAEVRRIGLDDRARAGGRASPRRAAPRPQAGQRAPRRRRHRQAARLRAGQAAAAGRARPGRSRRRARAGGRPRRRARATARPRRSTRWRSPTTPPPTSRPLAAPPARRARRSRP